MSVWTKISGKCFPYCWISGTKIKIFWWNKKAQILTCCVKPVNWCIKLYLTKYSYCRLLYQILHIIQESCGTQRLLKPWNLWENSAKAIWLDFQGEEAFEKLILEQTFYAFLSDWTGYSVNVVFYDPVNTEMSLFFFFFNRWTYLNLQKLLSLNTSTNYYN